MLSSCIALIVVFDRKVNQLRFTDMRSSYYEDDVLPLQECQAQS